MVLRCGRYGDAMSTTTQSAAQPPLTFRSAPIETRDGRRQLTDDAARELGDQLATRYASLLDRLAQE